MVRFALTVLILAGAVAACAPSRPPWADGQTVTTVRPPGAGQSLAGSAERLLATHNEERARVGIPPLVWDPSLAAAAADYAAVLAARGALAHSPREARPGQGENLWMGTRGAYQLEEMVGHWAAERSLFQPGIFPAVSRSGHWEDVAHYTQMIWRTTTRLGCALDSGRGSDVLVCRYSPPGNVTGQRVP